MNTNRWNRVRYTFYAPIYDRITGGFARDRRRSIELLNVQAGETVLIVGAGTGADLDYLHSEATITATDITPAMVARIQARAARLNRVVTAVVMDGQALEFPDGYFDVVVLHLIVAVIPDPIKCFKEAIRVTKPGGRVAVFDKFLPDEQRPALKRRLLNGVTNFLFSNINRRMGDLLVHVPVTIEQREAAQTLPQAGYEIILLRKIGNV